MAKKMAKLRAFSRPWRGRSPLVGPALAIALLAMTTPADAESIAFYYGAELPPELVRVYQRVVVDADALERGGIDIAKLGGERAKLFAYLSVGELARGARPASFQDDWIMAENPAWQSDVADLTNAGWRRYILEERMAALWQKGYRGFFLDTLDSYVLGAKTPEAKSAQASALAALIAEMTRRYRGVELIANRGFEILDHIAPLVSGLVAESLYDRWDPAAKRYVPVPLNDRQWLLNKLTQVGKQYGLPITVIDYRPPGERKAARETAQRIAAHGFDPWVTNSDLTAMGVGEPDIVSRRILVLYDGKDGNLAQTRALRLLAPILEYEGYVPEFRDVRKPLPGEALNGRYAGIATWFSARARRRRGSLLSLAIGCIRPGNASGCFWPFRLCATFCGARATGPDPGIAPAIGNSHKACDRAGSSTTTRVEQNLHRRFQLHWIRGQTSGQPIDGSGPDRCRSGHRCASARSRCTGTAARSDIHSSLGGAGRGARHLAPGTRR